MIPMKLASGAEPDGYLVSPDWVIEQKMDGTRAMFEWDVTQGSSRWLTTGGGELKFAAAKQHLPAITLRLEERMKELGMTHAVLDGELMIDSGCWFAFDMPTADTLHQSHAIDPSVGYLARRVVLHGILDRTFLATTNRIRVTAVAIGEQEKRTLFSAVRELGGEGVVAKHRDAPYEEGKRSTFYRKLKFTRTADVIVTASTRGRNALGRETGSFSLAVRDGEELRPVGSCSAIGKPPVEIGDVIEVAYMAWTGSAMREPRMVRVRPDKTPEECTPEQFREYSRKEAGER